MLYGGHIYIKNIISCLSKVQIQLRVLYFIQQTSLGRKTQLWFKINLGHHLASLYLRIKLCKVFAKIS